MYSSDYVISFMIFKLKLSGSRGNLLFLVVERYYFFIRVNQTKVWIKTRTRQIARFLETKIHGVNFILFSNLRCKLA